MATRPRGNDSSSNADDMGAIIAIPAGFIILLIAFWIFNKESLYYGAAKMTFWMLYPLKWIEAVEEYRLSILTDVLNVPDPFLMLMWIMNGWRAPAAILASICLYAAWKAYKHPISFMKGTLTVDALLRHQATIHSPIAPIVSISQTLHENKDERFHEAWHPNEFVEKFKLTNEDGSLDREKTEQLFIKQLGRRLYRPGLDEPDVIFADRFNNYEKAIFAMLAPLAIKIKDGLEEYEKLMDALNYSAVNAKQLPDLRLAQELFDIYRVHPDLNNLFRTHHFSTTYLMQLYILAKRAGKISTSHWVGWLRPNANGLYAALNCAGRQVAFTEAAGAFDHWKFERKCQKEARMPVLPCVVSAVDALSVEWEFWRTADQRVTTETLWGRMKSGEQDTGLYKRYVSEVLMPRDHAAPAGDDTIFDEQETAAASRAEDEALARLMSGIKTNFSNGATAQAGQ